MVTISISIGYCSYIKITSAIATTSKYLDFSATLSQSRISTFTVYFLVTFDFQEGRTHYISMMFLIQFHGISPYLQLHFQLPDQHFTRISPSISPHLDKTYIVH